MPQSCHCRVHLIKSSASKSKWKLSWHYYRSSNHNPRCFGPTFADRNIIPSTWLSLVDHANDHCKIILPEMHNVSYVRITSTVHEACCDSTTSKFSKWSHKKEGNKSRPKERITYETMPGYFCVVQHAIRDVHSMLAERSEDT